MATNAIERAEDFDPWADPEPLPAEHPLWRAPGVLISPHVGGNTSAFLPRARRLVQAQVSRWAAGEPLEHVVARGVRSSA